MSSDKKRLYILSLSLLAVLLLCFFINVNGLTAIVAGLLVVTAGLSYHFIKRRSALSIQKQQVILILSITALVYLMLYYLSGLSFGFFKNKIKLTSALMTILLFGVTTLSIEYLRSLFIGRDDKWIGFIIFTACVLVDVLQKYSLSVFKNFDRFMDFIGLVVFPAITFNLLFCYTAKKFGAIPSISYKLIVNVIPQFIGIKPAIPSSLLAFVELILPILILLFLRLLYEKKKREKKPQNNTVAIITTIVTIIVMAFIMAVISCQFRFGALVIATDSMTGSLNRGDMIVYERFDGQAIEENQVVVFNQDGSTIVHRVIKVEIIDGQYRYTTKGDFNEHADDGFISNNDIQGVVQFKIAYFGYPTLWLRDIFK